MTLTDEQIHLIKKLLNGGKLVCLSGDPLIFNLDGEEISSDLVRSIEDLLCSNDKDEYRLSYDYTTMRFAFQDYDPFKV